MLTKWKGVGILVNVTHILENYFKVIMKGNYFVYFMRLV